MCWGVTACGRPTRATTWRRPSGELTAPLDATPQAWLYGGAVGGLPLKALVIALAVAACAGSAQAGAWPMPKGQGQVITRYERQSADSAFDASGGLQSIESRWDESAVVFLEYGLTERMTLQGKLGYARGADAFSGYDGAAPAELGLRWNAVKRGRTVVSIYGGAISPGEGENAIYVSRKPSDGELEARLLVGRSGRWRGRTAFIDLQAARMWRFGAADETRFDATVGLDVTRNWLVLVQTYGGETDGADDGLRPGWLNAEVSAVRRFRDGWRGQLGYRTAYQGRESTAGHGPVVAVWRSF